MAGPPSQSSFLSSWVSVLGPREVGIWTSLIILLVSIFAPTLVGLEREMQLVLGVFGATLVLWLTEAVPYVISSTLAVVLLYAFGLVDTFGAAVQGFAETLVFFCCCYCYLAARSVRSDLGKS